MNRNNRLNQRRNAIQHMREDFLSLIINQLLAVLNFLEVNFTPIPPPPFHQYPRFNVVEPPNHIKFYLINKT